MDKLTKKYYITTPIYYVNAKPHLGTLYSTLLADVLARWHKIQGYNTFFLTGTDEHGQKIAEAASKVSMQPSHFVDQFIDAFKNLWKEYHIDYSYFIRTTDPEHKTAVQQWLKKLIDQGDIYKAYYTGWYCTSCETFITEKDLENQQGIPKCPSCGRETKELSEESYFFRLSNYQEQLLAFYQEHPDFITPKERMQEVINFVKSGLKDFL
ncbi:MAG: class I tRNA ligase family protein, partial [Candidatus Dependentiae bacterium]|nr:class I tRNA ligase family protein [Candidatus Dependentiae bacterium]